MTKYSNALLLLTLTILVGCTTTQSVSEKNQEKPFVWEAAVYFLMTDRFYNGDKSNDTNFNRTKTTGKLRGFEGGGESQKKIDEGYFDKLGINAIWFTPIVEQIHDAVDEGTGLSFSRILGKRWTALDLWNKSRLGQLS
jgi:alpha-amylase